MSGSIPQRKKFGQVGEWLIPGDCKSPASGYVSSNLTLSTKLGPLAQLVEQETLNLFVASSTLAWFTKDRGISSAGRAIALQAIGQRFDPVILHQ